MPELKEKKKGSEKKWANAFLKRSKKEKWKRLAQNGRRSWVAGEEHEG